MKMVEECMLYAVYITYKVYIWNMSVIYLFRAGILHFFMLFLMLLLCDWQAFVELTAPMRQSTLWTLAPGQTFPMRNTQEVYKEVATEQKRLLHRDGKPRQGCKTKVSTWHMYDIYHMYLTYTTLHK